MVIWAPEARKDAQEAWLFIAADNERYADKTIELIVTAAERVSRFPGMGRKGWYPGTREFHIPRTSYFLVYKIAEKDVEVLRVMHTSRQWPLRD